MRDCLAPSLSLMALTKGAKVLLGLACAYGLAHAIPAVQACRTWVYPRANQPMLLVDKVFVVAVLTASTPLLWPFMLREDLIRLECLVRGKPVTDYLPADDEA